MSRACTGEPRYGEYHTEVTKVTTTADDILDSLTIVFGQEPSLSGILEAQHILRRIVPLADEKEDLRLAVLGEGLMAYIVRGWESGDGMTGEKVAATKAFGLLVDGLIAYGRAAADEERGVVAEVGAAVNTAIEESDT
jgi:hypothetical protein